MLLTPIEKIVVAEVVIVSVTPEIILDAMFCSFFSCWGLVVLCDIIPIMNLDLRVDSGKLMK